MIKCRICNMKFKRLGLHILKKHNMKTKHYYESYIYVRKKCVICNKKFIGMPYRVCCEDRRCIQKNMVNKGRLGKPAWNSGKTKLDDKKLRSIGRKISISNSGKKRTKEQRFNYSSAFKRDYATGVRKVWNEGLTAKSDMRLQISGSKAKKTRLKHGGYVVSTYMRNRLSRILKEGYKSGRLINSMLNKRHSEETKEKIRIKRMLQKFPTHKTSIERKFIRLVKRYKLPYRYVGNGGFWIKNLNPDFLNINGKKQVIEIFGDYWHNPDLNKNCKENSTEEGRKKFFKDYGFDCIVLWEKEFEKDGWEIDILRKLGFNDVSQRI